MVTWMKRVNARPQPEQLEFPLPEVAKNTPLPGAMMSRGNQEKLIPKKPAANDAGEKSKKVKPHYADGGDHDQTIPI